MTPKSPSNLRRLTLLDCLLVFVAGMFCYGYRLGDSHLAGTEGHRALTAHQMVRTGDWLLPHLYDQLYLKKPPLQYWIIGAAEAVSGRADEFIWRLPCAIGSALLGAILCAFANRWFSRPAGLVAGFSHLALLTLWEQNRSADIDALNSLAAVAAACVLIDGIIAGDWMHWLAAGLAIGATMMFKGPAGLTIVAGALIGPAWMNRSWRMLKKPGPWMSLFIGIAIFAVYAAIAYWAIHARHLPSDTSGLAEAADKANALKDPLRLLQAATLPLVLFFAALPVSLAIPLAIHPAVWNDSDEPIRVRVRAIVGALAGAAVVCFASGMINPRYAYVLLPVLCPLSGAVVAAARRGVYPRAIAATFPFLIAGSAAALGGASVVLAILVLPKETTFGAVALDAASVVAAVVICVVVVYALSRKCIEAAALALLGLVLTPTAPFASFQHFDRERRSSYVAAMRLDKAIAPDTRIVTGCLPLDQPELFYYAGVGVHSYPEEFKTPYDLKYTGWVLFQRDEFAAWKAAQPDRMTHVQILWPERNNMYLVMYLENGKH